MIQASNTNHGPPPIARTAFVVDDDRQMRTLICKVLSAGGFVCHEFTQIRAIEAALTQVKPEVIVLDLSLGESDAVEVIRTLRDAHFKGKVLLVSGHDSATLGEVQRIGERHGLLMLPFLRKPFPISELRRHLSIGAGAEPPASTACSLLAALENNWLELWYQPKIDLKTFAICGAEALVRIRHPQRGILLPGSFLPPPGDALYRPLTDFVIRRSLADWRVFEAAGMPIRLAINVPSSELQDSHFVGEVRKHLPQRQDFPGLIVEITEDEALGDPESAREAAIQLKLYDIHVSIDDFGTGYSTLARLDELPFAELKLDRMYVSGCSTDPAKRMMCESVVDLAHRYGVTAIAEGVEELADLRTLISLGYDIAQGYFFAKPMEIAEFVKLKSPLQAQESMRAR